MLRWAPQVTLEKGLARTAEWFIAAGFADSGDRSLETAGRVARGTTVRTSIDDRAAMAAAESAAPRLDRGSATTSSRIVAPAPASARSR